MDKATQKPPPITDAQARVLLFVADYIEADPLDRSPTFRKIAAGLNLAKSTVGTHLVALKEQKCIDGEPYVQRSLSMTRGGMLAVDRLRNPPDSRTPAKKRGRRAAK